MLNEGEGLAAERAGEGVVGCVQGCIQDVVGCKFEVNGVESSVFLA